MDKGVIREGATPPIVLLLLLLLLLLALAFVGVLGTELEWEWEEEEEDRFIKGFTSTCRLVNWILVWHVVHGRAVRGPHNSLQFIFLGAINWIFNKEKAISPHTHDISLLFVVW